MVWIAQSVVGFSWLSRGPGKRLEGQKGLRDRVINSNVGKVGGKTNTKGQMTNKWSALVEHWSALSASFR